MAISSYIKDSKKYFLVEVKIRNSSGKQIYRSRQGIASERKAEEAEFQLRKEVEAVLNKKPALSWGVWLARTLEKMKYKFEPSTLYNYEKCLARHVVNPCTGMSVKAPINDQKVLNRLEVNKLLTEARRTNHYFYNVWIMALYSGLRPGELFALLWSDIDLENRIVHVNKSWSSKNGLKDTKSGRSRVVPISDELLRFL